MPGLNRRQRIAFFSGAVLLALMWLIPPWRCSLWPKDLARCPSAVMWGPWFQYAWFFAPPTHGMPDDWEFSTYIVWNRLWGQTAAVLLVTWITTSLLGRRRETQTEAADMPGQHRIRHSPRFLVGFALTQAAFSCVVGFSLVIGIYLYGAIAIQGIGVFTLGDCTFLPLALPLWEAGLAKGPILTIIPVVLNGFLWAAVVWYVFQFLEASRR